MEIIKCALVIEYGGADCALLLLNLLLCIGAGFIEHILVLDN